MAEKAKTTTAVAEAGKNVEAVECPHCGEPIETCPLRLGLGLWSGDPTPHTCPGCGEKVILRLVYFEVMTAQTATPEALEDFAAHLAAAGNAIDDIEIDDGELAQLLVERGATMRARAGALTKERGVGDGEPVEVNRQNFRPGDDRGRS